MRLLVPLPVPPLPPRASPPLLVAPPPLLSPSRSSPASLRPQITPRGADFGNYPRAIPSNRTAAEPRLEEADSSSPRNSLAGGGASDDEQLVTCVGLISSQRARDVNSRPSDECLDAQLPTSAPVLLEPARSRPERSKSQGLFFAYGSQNPWDLTPFRPILALLA